MKKRLSVILLLAFALSVSGFSQKKNLTYQQAYGDKRPRVIKPLPGITGWFDNDHYLETKTGDENRQVVKVEAATGKETTYLDYSVLNEKLDEGFDLNKSATSTDDLQHFILVKEMNLYYYNTSAGSLKQLTFSEALEKNPTFSPDNKRIAFTRENNLYVVDLVSGKETRLTNDGSELILNGYASWVYYEEILGRGSRYRAFWWSPDASMIAYLRFDDSPVPEFPLFNADGVHGSLEITHYPKPGDSNPFVKLGIAHLNSGKTVWMETNEDEDRYVAWPFWTIDSKELVYQYMNRDQDEITFFASNPNTGLVRSIYTEKQKSWVEFFEDVYVFEDGKGFILRSDKSGWRNLYHYDLQGNLVNQITDFDWRVTGISMVD
ncbi:MAG: DPP IV N-terminal domain-containing protein, partial [Bacteroidota bacterium]|nr:DPP IV N-terminal domain-containing protein [Bacteroidota bacterium]